MALRFAVKVASGPGTSGHDKHTPKQNAKKTTWAQFAMSSDAEVFAFNLRIAHSTWIVTVHDLALDRYNIMQTQIERAKANVVIAEKGE